MQDLAITIVQTNIKWCDKDYNLNRIKELLASQKAKSDLIVLPEMFNTGFSMDASVVGEKMNGQSVNYLIELAKKHQTTFCGSLVIEEGNNYYNRMVFVDANGLIDHYDKRHPFSFLGEDEVYTAGSEKKILEIKGWKISPMICYDLRFPAWCRNQEDYDLQLFVANWPKKRSHHWKSLLHSRAIENQSYVIGVNRVGDDDKGNSHDGNSSVFDFSGETLYNVVNEEAVKTITLSYDKLIAYRKRYPFLNDRDEFEFKH